VTVTPDLEDPRPPGGEGFSDAITFSFGDPDADVYAVARVGLSGEASASGLGLVFSGGEPVSVQADGVVDITERTWSAIDAAGLATTIERPLEAWTLAFASDAATFDLQVEAVSAAGEMADGGMEGYEQLCRFTGDATVAGRRVTIDCLGQRGHSWGAPDWEQMALARTLGAWIGDDLGVSLLAIRPAGSDRHDQESIAAYVYDGGEPIQVQEPRLSTGYDAAQRQRRAGLELWIDEESPARRAAGEVVCGTSLDLGRLRLDCAFLRWHMEGREGIGRYDILRRVS
jgi:pyruvate-formate lyase-activating enzyme